MNQPSGDATAVLQRRVSEIDAEIEALRGHQRAILPLLGQARALRRAAPITKEKWIAVMRGAGFTERDMDRWHTEFESSAPDEHAAFLKFLRISPAQIRTIRAWSRKGRQA